MNCLRNHQRFGAAALLLLGIWSLPASAQPLAAPLGGSSSASFCLFEASLPQSDKRIFLNLGIVQYVELRADEVRVYYGGGNLGSGHEFRMPVRSDEEAQAYLQRMQATAANCAAK